VRRLLERRKKITTERKRGTAELGADRRVRLGPPWKQVEKKGNVRGTEILKRGAKILGRPHRKSGSGNEKSI